MENKLSTAKAANAIIGSLIILIIAQIAAVEIGRFSVECGLSGVVSNILMGILYPAFTFLGVYLLCHRVLKLPIAECNIKRMQIKPVWAVAAFLMPAITTIILLLTAGHWEKNYQDAGSIGMIVSGAVMYYGIATGIVEEMLFRGVIMKAMEYRYNKLTAIIVPSVLFGLLHIFGNSLDFLSVLQLLIAGSVVGILLSLVTYESGSIWSSALIHCVWNIVMIGGIIHIGSGAEENALYNYILESDSFLVTGGDFGVEASGAAILSYGVFIFLAWHRLNNTKKKGEKENGAGTDK